MVDADLIRKKLAFSYENVDLRVVRDILDHRLGDLEEYCARLRGRL